MMLFRLEIEQEFTRMFRCIDHSKFRGTKGCYLRLESIMRVAEQDKTQSSSESFSKIKTEFFKFNKITFLYRLWTFKHFMAHMITLIEYMAKIQSRIFTISTSLRITFLICLLMK